MRSTLLLVGVLAACGNDRAPPPRKRASGDAAAPIAAVDAAPGPTRRALPTQPVSPDGAPLPLAAITLGSPAFRVPGRVDEVYAFDGTIIATLIDGRVLAMDPVTGERRELAKVSAQINAVEQRGAAIVLAITPDSGSEVATQIHLGTGAVTPAYTADVAWGLDVHGDALLVHDILTEALRVVDLPSGRSTPVHGLSSDEMLQARLLAGGRVLVLDHDGQLEVVDRKTGTHRVKLDTTPYAEPWRSPDRSQLAFAKDHPVDEDGWDTGPQDLLVWDVVRGKVLRRLALATTATAFAWLADGGYVTGDFDGKVVHWDARGRRVAETDLGAQMIVSIAELPVGRLAVATAGETIRVVALDTMTATPAGNGHLGSVKELEVAGDRLVSLGMDGTVRVWDLSTGREARVLPIPVDEYTADLAIEPAGDAVVALSQVGDETAGLTFWGLDGSRRGRITWPGKLTTYATVVAAPDGSHAVLGGEVRWEIDRTGRVGPPIHVDGDLGRAKVGVGIVAVPEEGHVSMGASLKLPTRGCAQVNTVTLSPRGDLVAVSDAANTLGLWRRDGTKVGAIDFPDRYPIGVAIGASPPVVVDPASEGLLIWDVGAHELIRPAIEPLDEVLVTDDRWLIGSTADGRIGVWDLAALRASGEVTTVADVDVTC